MATAVPASNASQTPGPVELRPVSLGSPLVTSTPVWVKQGPGEVLCPILLYHHIGTTKSKNPYFVSVDEFRTQMQALKDWGYTTISATLLADALEDGARLPLRPIVITFDDGDESVYTTAYPIMRELGFIGVNYVVADYIGKSGYMDMAQLKELAGAGWETGSHTLSHKDLTTSPNSEKEVAQSRRVLEKLLGVTVVTIAYPFGRMKTSMLGTVAKNYRAGMGLGVLNIQKRADIYYLWRRPVRPGWDVQTFGSFLPWNTPMQP
ncbi:MAG TPA: polysaccharide deacetylase family protein [Anaerolineales bacterium]|jgi:peptidoglycan/xylan/chitin deacetylase (PgdA/CDA1 family)